MYWEHAISKALAKVGRDDEVYKRVARSRTRVVTILLLENINAQSGNIPIMV